MGSGCSCKHSSQNRNLTPLHAPVAKRIKSDAGDAPGLSFARLSVNPLDRQQGDFALYGSRVAGASSLVHCRFLPLDMGLATRVNPSISSNVRSCQYVASPATDK